MTAFKPFSNHYTPIINRYLDTCFSGQLNASRETLKQAILHSLLAPAKRIRPLILIASFKQFSDTTEKIMPIAAAIEMVHTYSLIHDDLPAMDNDDLRRGLPTCHVKFGEDIAILAGDVLNTFAFQHLSETLTQHYSAEQVLMVMKKLGEAFGIHGMAGGQALDLRASNTITTLEELEEIHDLKTGRIIQECFSLPALLESKTDTDYEKLHRIGKLVGRLFQVIDDILDIKGDTTQLGKSAKKDLAQNKATYTALLGIDGAEECAKNLASTAKSLVKELSSDQSHLLENLIDYIVERTY